MTVNRRRAREEALQLLYALEISRNSLEDVLKDTSVIRSDDSAFDPFTISLIEKAVKVSKDCNLLIEKHARNWKLNRIALIDNLILRLAITEFLFFPNIPPKVSINEALEIAKKFSTANSGRFINGILDAILAELVAGHKIHKEGRGLDTETTKPVRNTQQKASK